MMRRILKFTMLLCALVTISTSAQAFIFDWDRNDDDIQNAQLVKVQMIDAIKKVTEAHKGVIITSNLEKKEDGRLVYEIDLVHDGEELEIWVDAVTGQMSEIMED